MEAIEIDTEALTTVCRANDIDYLALFGSVARGEATPESDIDLLVHFSRRKSLLDLVRVEREIAEVLGRDVDLLTEASISPHLREQILRETQVLYEEGA